MEPFHSYTERTDETLLDDDRRLLCGVCVTDGLVFAQPADEPVSKTCREGPRAREIELQKIEPFKVFDNLYHASSLIAK